MLLMMFQMNFRIGVMLAFTSAILFGHTAFAAETESAPIPTSRPEYTPSIADTPPSIFAPFKKDLACEDKLKTMGVIFKKGGSVQGKPGCGFAESFEIITLKGGITVKPATRLRCETVLAVSEWVTKGVTPNLKLLGNSAKLTNIRQASSYVCRRRNNLPTGKLSEHAKGAAIDIRGFDFKNRDTIIIELRNGTKEAAFQNAVRDAACGPFTTVLGPGSDPYHNDHLHFDIAQRKNNYRYCK